MKLLMINPPSKHADGSTNPRIYLPIGLLYLASMLEKHNHQVKVYDGRLSAKITKDSNGNIHFGDSWEEVRKVIQDFNPEIVCISCMFSNQSSQAFKTAEIAKEISKDILAVVGGPHPSVDTAFVNNKFVDIQVSGEGEFTILDIVDYFNGKKKLDEIKGIAFKENDEVKIMKKREFIDALDEIPFPAYHLVDMEEYFNKQNHGYGARPLIRGKRVVSMITSRGCPYECTFCSIFLSMGRKFRYHSPNYVLNHIQLLKEKYGVDFILFEDDNMSLRLKRFDEILEGMISRRLNDVKWGVINGLRADTLSREMMLKMKRAGCSYVVIAIESGVQRVVNDVIKKYLDLKKVVRVCEDAMQVKMEMYAYYIVGFPDETMDEIKQTINFAMMLDDKYGVFPMVNIATPLYGTELYSRAEETGSLVQEVTEEGLLKATQTHGSGLIQTSEFTFEDLQKENKRLNRNIFKNLVKRSILHPPLLVNYISTTIKNPYVIKKYVFGKG